MVSAGGSDAAGGAAGAGAAPAAAGDMSFFVTSEGSGVLGGNLGGLEGADEICQGLADAVGAGDKVEAGQPLATVEAMKMENILRAEKSGVVKTVNAVQGDSLAVDAIILEME